MQADRVSNFTFPTMRVGRGEESNDPGRSTVPGGEKKKIEGRGASIPGSLQACGERDTMAPSEKGKAVVPPGCPDNPKAICGSVV